MNLDKKYLPTLDSLRFIAASLVLIGHIDIALYQNKYKDKMYDLFPFCLGEKSVVFFFVLSGFLITYLLLKEKEIKPINIKAFYLKRIFRIWPVYFIVIIASFAYFNNAPYFEWKNSISTPILKPWDYVLLCLISPNILLLHLRNIGNATVTWSIGVEEQFYAIWPWIARKKNLIIYIIGIILFVYVFSRGAIACIAYLPFVPNAIKSILLPISQFFSYDYSFKIDEMAIGALGAYLIINKKVNILNILFNKKVQIFTYVAVLLLLIFPLISEYHFYGLLFTIIILNVSFNDDSIFRLDNKITNYLGRISYGIYMYHWFFMIPVIKFCIDIHHMRLNLFTEFLMCLLCLCLTIALSSLSYHLVELNFLKLKNRILSKKDKSVHIP